MERKIGVGNQRGGQRAQCARQRRRAGTCVTLMKSYVMLHAAEMLPSGVTASQRQCARYCCLPCSCRVLPAARSHAQQEARYRRGTAAARRCLLMATLHDARVRESSSADPIRRSCLRAPDRRACMVVPRAIFCTLHVLPVKPRPSEEESPVDERVRYCLRFIVACEASQHRRQKYSQYIMVRADAMMTAVIGCQR